MRNESRSRFIVSDPPKADKNPLIKAAATPLSREGGDEASANDEPLEYGSLLQPARYSKGDRGRSAAAPLALLRETDAHLKCVLAQYEEEDGVLVRCSRSGCTRLVGVFVVYLNSQGSMGAHARQLSRLRLKSLCMVKPEINGEVGPSGSTGLSRRPTSSHSRGSHTHGTTPP